MLRQLSIFVENQPGNLFIVTSALKEHDINIRAIAAFDTPEFGILRLVVDRPQEAKEYLTSKGFVVRITEVIAVELEDKKGNLNSMLDILGKAGVNINYIYSFVIRENCAPVMVFHTDHPEDAIEVLKENQIVLIEEHEL